MSPTRLWTRAIAFGLVSSLLAVTLALGANAEPEARMKNPNTSATSDVTKESGFLTPEQARAAFAKRVLTQPATKDVSAATSTTTATTTTTEPTTPTGAEPASETDSAQATATSTTISDDAAGGAEKTASQAAPAEPEIDMRTSGEIEEENAQAEALRYEEAVRHYYLGHFYQDKWDLNLATTEYDQAISYSPDLKIAHRDLCWVSILSGNLPRAVAEFMMVVGLGEPVPYSEQEKTDLNHRALALHYKKGLEYARAQDWKNSQNELNWALTYDPNDWAVHRSLAFVYASQGNYKQAEEEYQEALTLRPADPGSTHADLAFVLLDAGEKQAAQEQMIEAVKSSPNAAAFHVDLGFVAETRGDYATAVSELRKALELKPKHAGLWARLGHLLERQGKPTEAEVAYNMAINIDPTQIDELKDELERLRKNHS